MYPILQTFAMMRRQLSSPEMGNPPILPPEYVHHRQLHVIAVSLALVIRLIGGLRSGNQRNLRPSTFPRPRIDSFGRGFGNRDERGMSGDLIRASIESIDQRRTEDRDCPFGRLKVSSRCSCAATARRTSRSASSIAGPLETYSSFNRPGRELRRFSATSDFVDESCSSLRNDSRDRDTPASFDPAVRSCSLLFWSEIVLRQVSNGGSIRALCMDARLFASATRATAGRSWIPHRILPRLRALEIASEPESMRAAAEHFRFHVSAERAGPAHLARHPRWSATAI